MLESILTRVLKAQTRPEVVAAVEQLQRSYAVMVHDSDGAQYPKLELLKIIDGLDP